MSTTDPFVRAPRFRARLSDGRVLEGTIQGSGGRLGNGATQAGQRGAERAASERLALWVRWAEARLVSEVFVSLIPTGPDEHGDGEWEARVEVPLVGTRFDLLPARSVGCAACDGLGVVDDRGFPLRGQPFFDSALCGRCAGDRPVGPG